MASVHDRVPMRVFDFDGTDDPPEATEYTREAIQSESTLEDWCHCNPEILLREPVFVFGRQYSLESGIPDLLALDQYGNVIVFELKVGKSGTGSASEETILGQPQSYARALQSFTYPDLNDIYQTYQSYIDEGRWGLPEDVIMAPDLREAHEEVFGTSLKPAEFNPAQRLVIVAEEITDQTRENARYLLQQGLHLQCLEVQRFRCVDEGLEASQSVLATVAPVDYDLSRVKPDRGNQPVYSDQIQRIVERAFPELRSVVKAETPVEVFDDFEDRSSSLTSNAEFHPDAVEYAIRIWPQTDGVVMVAVDIFDDDLLKFVRDNSDIFQQEGFEINHTRGMFRIVTDCWNVNTISEVDDQLLNEVADRYVDLVETGHELFKSVDSSDRVW